MKSTLYSKVIDNSDLSAVQGGSAGGRRLGAWSDSQILGSSTDLVRQLRLLRAETLLFPGIAVGVVAVLFPESPLVFVQELDRADPLGALPGVEVGNDEP